MVLKNISMYAILGILNLAPSTGYDIKKYSDKVLSGFWNENFGHIYPTLKMMLADGMIDILPGEINEKKVRYAITEKGQKEYEAWLLEETVQQPARSEFMLKLLFSSSLPREKVISMLEDYTHRLIEMFAPRLVLGISDEISSTGDIERVRVVGRIVDENNAAEGGQEARGRRHTMRTVP